MGSTWQSGNGCVLHKCNSLGGTIVILSEDNLDKVAIRMGLPLNTLLSQNGTNYEDNFLRNSICLATKLVND